MEAIAVILGVHSTVRVTRTRGGGRSSTVVFVGYSPGSINYASADETVQKECAANLPALHTREGDTASANAVEIGPPKPESPDSQ